MYGDNPTIYDSLMEAQKTWKIYYSDIPWSFIVPHVRDNADHVVKLKNFKKDVERGTLPNFSLIEPAYLNTLTHKATDQDAPHDVREGERLIADVYNTLRKSADWDKTLLVICYDEHGGYYDHVPPPACTPPDTVPSKHAKFDFDRLGVRVPAILLGGRVPSGVVDHTVYDHTSIPRFMEKLYDLKPLSGRDATIATFDHQIQDQINHDTPFQVDMPERAEEQRSSPLRSGQTDRPDVQRLGHRLPGLRRAHQDGQQGEALAGQIAPKMAQPARGGSQVVGVCRGSDILIFENRAGREEELVCSVLWQYLISGRRESWGLCEETLQVWLTP